MVLFIGGGPVWMVPRPRPSARVLRSLSIEDGSIVLTMALRFDYTPRTQRRNIGVGSATTVQEVP